MAGTTGQAAEQVLYERRAGAAWIVLNRPAVLNSLTPQLVAGVRAGLRRAEADPEMRCVVITGAGRGFCVGTDLAAVRGDHGPFDLRTFLESMRDGLLEIEASPLPVLAAVNGVACAGGMELILACDLVVAAEEARIGDAHANYGLIPGGGASVRLVERVGPVRAKQLLFSGDLLPAATLCEWGVVSEIVPAAQLAARVDEIAAMFASRSPLSVARMKQLARQALELPRRDALDREIALAVEHQGSADVAEGLAAFVEKRAPRFTGR